MLELADAIQTSSKQDRVRQDKKMTLSTRRRNSSRKITLSLLSVPSFKMLPVFILASCILTVWSQIHGGPHEATYRQVFGFFDVNSDNHITMAEFDETAPELDRNGDGNVTKTEFIEAWEDVTTEATDPVENIHSAELLWADFAGDNNSIPVSNLDSLFQVFNKHEDDNSVSIGDFLAEWERIHAPH